MCGQRPPGPMCQVENPIDIDGGTMCLAATPPPGPVNAYKYVSARLDAPSVAGLISGRRPKSPHLHRKPKHPDRRALNWTDHHAKSLLLSILDLVPFKPDSPYSTAMLKHYVESSGELYEIKDVPKEWQDWIVKVTHGKLGVHKSLSPYNSGIYDLRNSLGHFDVTVTTNKNGTKTYTITDTYGFGYAKHDKNQTGRHGFPLGKPSPTTLRIIKMLLPSQEYVNPGGFKEHWEAKQIGKDTYLLIPQQFLAEQGKPFPVKGVFKR